MLATPMKRGLFNLKQSKSFVCIVQKLTMYNWEWKVWMLTTAMLIPFVFLSSPGLSITWEKNSFGTIILIC